MRIEDIEIHAGPADRAHHVIGPIKARVGASHLLSKTPTLEDVNFKLREEAVKLGANGIIDVAYDRGVSMTSWKALTATGTAVMFEEEHASSTQRSSLDELERLARLRNDGTLTDEEFEQEKRKLLS